MLDRSEVIELWRHSVCLAPSCMQLFPNLSTLLGAYNYSYGENGTVRPIEISLTQYSQGVLCTVQKPSQCHGAPNTSE